MVLPVLQKCVCVCVCVCVHLSLSGKPVSPVPSWGVVSTSPTRCTSRPPSGRTTLAVRSVRCQEERVPSFDVFLLIAALSPSSRLSTRSAPRMEFGELPFFSLPCGNTHPYIFIIAMQCACWFGACGWLLHEPRTLNGANSPPTHSQLAHISNRTTLLLVL